MNLRTCSSCKQNLPFDLFFKAKGGKDGLRANCKECERVRNLSYRQRNRDKVRAARRQYDLVNADKLRLYVRTKRSEDPEKYRLRDNTRRYNHPEKWLLKGARVRAKEAGCPFTITLGDILLCVPEDGCCPITKLPFVIGRGKSERQSMTLDRIIPELGYVPGNIAVISHFANTIKQNCVDPEIFRRIAAYIEEALNKCP